MRRLLLVVFLCLALPLAVHAFPYKDEIEQAVSDQDYPRAIKLLSLSQAETIDDPLPYYWMSRVLTMQGRFDEAWLELKNAKRVARGEPFTTAERLAAYEKELTTKLNRAAPARTLEAGFWVAWSLGVAVLAVLLYRSFVRRQR